MRNIQILAMVALGAAACGPSISFQRDPSCPVPSGAAWSWGASDAGRTFAEKHPMVDNATVRSRIEAAIARELEAKGFSYVSDSTQAAFFFHFHVGVEERHEVIGERRPCAMGEICNIDWGYWGRPEAEPRVIEYEAGQLIIDAVDVVTRKVIWRGKLENDFVKGDVEEAVITKYVRRLLKGFKAS